MENGNQTYSEDLWDGFYSIIANYKKNKEWMKGIYNNWKVEGDHLGKLGKYYKSSLNPKRGGSEVYGELFANIEDQLREYHNFLGEKYVTMGTLVEKDLYTSLHDIKMHLSVIIKTNSANEKKLEKTLKGVQSQVTSSHATDQSQGQALTKLVNARKAGDDATVPPKKLEKMNKQLLAAKENAMRARSEYEKKVELLKTTQHSYEEDMKIMLDSMQSHDSDRYEKARQIIMKYATKQVEFAKEMLAQAEKLQNAVQEMDPEKTIRDFIDANKSKNVREEPASFHPYFAQESEIEDLVSPFLSSATLSVSAVTSPEKSSKKVRALYDYAPQGDEEIEIKLDDIIEVHSQPDDGWWEGRNTRTGTSGLFPANYVEEYTPATPQAPAKSGDANLVTALYDYETTDPGELQFVEGDQLLVQERFDDGWCFAENTRTGQKGLAPANYLDS